MTKKIVMLVVLLAAVNSESAQALWGQPHQPTCYQSCWPVQEQYCWDQPYDSCTTQQTGQNCYDVQAGQSCQDVPIYETIAVPYCYTTGLFIKKRVCTYTYQTVIVGYNQDCQPIYQQQCDPIYENVCTTQYQTQCTTQDTWQCATYCN